MTPVPQALSQGPNPIHEGSTSGLSHLNSPSSWSYHTGDEASAREFWGHIQTEAVRHGQFRWKHVLALLLHATRVLQVSPVGMALGRFRQASPLGDCSRGEEALQERSS